MFIITCVTMVLHQILNSNNCTFPNIKHFLTWFQTDVTNVPKQFLGHGSEKQGNSFIRMIS